MKAKFYNGLFLIITATLVGSFCGCHGDFTFGTGEKGMTEYSTHTKYEMDGELDEVKMLAGVPHELDVELTWRGEQEINEYSYITHTIQPSEGAYVHSDCTPYETYDCTVMVQANLPGEYSLTTMLDGRVLDFITLRFERADRLDLIVKARAPYSEDFHRKYGETIEVNEGSQIVFVPVPVDYNGERLLGNIEYEFKINPSWAAVPGQNVGDVFENEDCSWADAHSFYLIEPGMIKLEVTENYAGYTGSIFFDVKPIKDNYDY